MNLLNYNTLIVLAGVSLLGASAGVIGSFAVLRRRSLIGDALAHAALPGICLAYLVVGERSLPAMLLGALVSGLVGVGLIQGLVRMTRIKQDAAIGFVRSVFYAGGVVLLVVINRQPGSGRSGLASFIEGKTAGLVLDDILWIAGLSLVALLLVWVLFKEFRLVSFDPDFASVQGWPTALLDLALLVLLVLAVVIGVPAVGVLLMAGLLVLPGATARFWTDQLAIMTWLALLFGMIAGCAGAALSATFERVPPGPSIILMGTAMFLLSLAFGTRRGLLARWLTRRRMRKEWGHADL